MKYAFSIFTTLVLSFSYSSGMDNIPESKKPEAVESRSIISLSDKQVAVTKQSSSITALQKSKSIKQVHLSLYAQENSQDAKYYRDLDEWAYGDIDSWGNR